MTRFKYIAIEGNIGAGKTTLAEWLSGDLGARLILEQFQQNTFLSKFYSSPERYALQAELYFLLDRYRQLRQESENFRDKQWVSDYTFAKCLIFAGITLPRDEFQLFKDVYQKFEKGSPQPDLIIYLHTPVERLRTHIRKRNRSYEAEIADDYLLQLEEGYHAFFSGYRSCPVLVLESENEGILDVADNYQKIRSLLEESWEHGNHRIYF